MKLYSCMITLHSDRGHTQKGGVNNQIKYIVGMVVFVLVLAFLARETSKMPETEAGTSINLTAQGRVELRLVKEQLLRRGDAEILENERLVASGPRTRKLR